MPGTVDWIAKEAEARISTTVLTSAQLTSTTSTLFSSLSSPDNWTGRVKNIAISGGSRDYAPVNVMGSVQLPHHGRPEVVQAEFTLVYEGKNALPYFTGNVLATATVATATAGQHYAAGTFSTYQFGEKTSSSVDRKQLAVILVFSNKDATTNKTVYCLLNNAYVTNRELSLDAEGTAEEKWTIKCLAHDYYEQDNFSS